VRHNIPVEIVNAPTLSYKWSTLGLAIGFSIVACSGQTVINVPKRVALLYSVVKT